MGADADVADRESCAEDLTDDLVAHAQDAAVNTLSRARVSLSRKLTAERRAFIEAAEAATEAQLAESTGRRGRSKYLRPRRKRSGRAYWPPSLLRLWTLPSRMAWTRYRARSARPSSTARRRFRAGVSSPIGAALVNRKAAFQRRAEQLRPDDTAGAVAVKIVRQAIDEVLAEEGSALIDEDAEVSAVRRAIEAALLAPTSAEPNGPDDAGASTPPDLLSSMVGLDEVVIDEEADEAKGYGKMRKHKRMSTTPLNDASWRCSGRRRGWL